MDMKVQESLWEKVLVASSWELVRLASDSDDTSDDDDWADIGKHRLRHLPSHVTPFWKLWRVDVWGPGTQTLIRRHNDDIRHYRVIFIVIAFLGPYTA